MYQGLKDSCENEIVGKVVFAVALTLNGELKRVDGDVLIVAFVVVPLLYR